MVLHATGSLARMMLTSTVGRSSCDNSPFDDAPLIEVVVFSADCWLCCFRLESTGTMRSRAVSSSLCKHPKNDTEERYTVGYKVGCRRRR